MNSGPYACVAGTLATDSSPQPRDFLFQDIESMILTKQSLILRKNQVLPIELGLTGSYAPMTMTT